MNCSVATRIERLSHVLENTSCTDSSRNKIALEDGLKQIQEVIKDRRKSNSLYVLGNGGSAAIASHAAIDFRNVCKISTSCFGDHSMLTCFSNDYGYENVYKEAVKLSVVENDLLFAVSSSGNSKNIIPAAEEAKRKGAFLVTFSGFKSSNNLRKIGDLNFWCNDNDYGIIEISHQFLLHNISDRFIK